MDYDVNLSSIILKEEEFFGLSKGYTPKIKGKQWIISIPEELKGFEIPKDINEFISKIYRNMRVSLIVRDKSTENVDEIINNFIVYMLEEGVAKKPRYQTFDHEKFPNIPFFKWWIKNLYFFWLTFHTQAQQKKLYVSISETIGEHNINGQGTMFIDLLTVKNSSGSPVSNAIVEELEEFLSNYSLLHEHGFESKAYWLFRAKLSKLSGSEMANFLGISQAAVSQWTTKLRELIKNYLEDRFDSTMLKALQMS